MQISSSLFTTRTRAVAPVKTNPTVRFSAQSKDTFTKTPEPFLAWNETVPFAYQSVQGVVQLDIERAGPKNLAQEDDKRVIQLVQLLDGNPVLPLDQITKRHTSYTDARNYFLLARDTKGHVISSGYMATMAPYHTHLADSALMGHLYVHPDHQGHGLASKLTDMRIAAGKQLGYHYLMLFTRNPIVEGSGKKAGIATQRHFQKIGASRGYHAYVLNLKTPGKLSARRCKAFSRAFGLQKTD